MNWVLFPLFHRSGSFFPSGPSALMHSYSLAALPASVHTIRVCVCVWETVRDGWRQSRTGWLACHQRSERARCASSCVCVCVYTTAVQCGDGPSSANEERQYGNVAHLCQQGTFSSAPVYFLGFRWEERKTARVHERSPLKPCER